LPGLRRGLPTLRAGLPGSFDRPESFRVGRSLGAAGRGRCLVDLSTYAAEGNASINDCDLPREGYEPARVLAPYVDRSGSLLGGWVEESVVQFGGGGVVLAGELGRGFEFAFLFGEVVVGFGLLECGLPVLADHDEGGQEDRFEGH